MNKSQEVVELCLEIANSIQHRGLMLNERYLHHYFSHLLQEKWNLMNLTDAKEEIELHPEWPTYKKQTNLCYGQYVKEGGKYLPSKNGTAGFIDFAVGNYKKPYIGIEFSLKYGWSNEEIVYDFLKLLDNKNPFDTSISLNLIFRPAQLVRGENLADLERHMNNAFDEAVKRLGNGVCNESRELFFIISEIDADNNRRHWHYSKTTHKFENGLQKTIGTI